MQIVWRFSDGMNTASTDAALVSPPSSSRYLTEPSDDANRRATRGSVICASWASRVRSAAGKLLIAENENRRSAYSA